MGTKISGGTSERWKPSGPVGWHPVRAPAPRGGGGCCHPCQRHPSPWPEAVRTPRRRGPGGGGKGTRDRTGVPGLGRAAGGCSGAGGLLALDGDLAAAAALAVLLVGGDLGRLDDQQPLRGQGGEHRDGIHLVGQPAGKGQEKRCGLGSGQDAASPLDPLGPTALGEPGQQRPGKASVITGAPGNVRGIFRAGSWPAWPPRELCLISPADVFDGMSAPLVRSGSRSRPCLAPKRSPSSSERGARPSLPVGVRDAQGSFRAEKQS